MASVSDIRDRRSFPDLGYRYSKIEKTENGVRLRRDFLGENPLHYYLERGSRELVVSNGVLDIKRHLERKGKTFNWDALRTVPNNSTVSINLGSFEVSENEDGPTLQGYGLPYGMDYSDLGSAGKKLRGLLEASIGRRLSSIDDNHVGLILSGGLDSMSVGYLLSREKGRKVTAFTMHVNENEADIVQSRKLTQAYGIDLVEVRIVPAGDSLSIRARKYGPKRKLIYEKEIAAGISSDAAFREAVSMCADPNKDNVLCAVSMYLIARAIVHEKITTVFCGEGPNEMMNDYGFVPSDYSGFSTSDKSDISFRETLTFGGVKFSKQLGRGGLGNYAVSRMSKVFAAYGIRLESPYFERDIARIMTRIPHLTGYDTIKQHLVQNMFPDDGLDGFIMGTSKMMFQDGSGIRKLFSGYDKRKTREIFRRFYGIRPPGRMQTILSGITYRLRGLRPS